MEFRLMIRIISASVLAGVLFMASEGTSLRAQTAPAQAFKERQEIMKQIWPAYYRDMSRGARGDITDLPPLAVKATEAVAQLKKFGTLFPAGSGREGVPETRAKPEVFTQRAEFDAAIAALATATTAFGEAAKSGDASAVKAQYAKIAEACGACHGGPAKSGGKFRFEE